MPDTPLLIDTHAHLYLGEFDADCMEVLERARQAGVGKIYLPNIDSGTIDRLIALEAAFPDLCHAMIGLHPGSVKENVEEELAIVQAWAGRRAFAAIGEIGTDQYWDTTHIDAQEMAFVAQIRLAATLGRPIVIHSRETLDLNIRLVSENAGPALKGVFHCFTGSPEQAMHIRELGFYLGIGGVITFRNARLAETIAQVPLESLVLETDAPYLTPHPYRGTRNESAHLQLVARKIAEVQGKSYEEVCEVTSYNATQLFA